MTKLHNDMMHLESWIKKDDVIAPMSASFETNTIHDKLDAIFNRIQMIEDGMNEIRTRVDAIEHKCIWPDYAVPGHPHNVVECDFFDPTYSPRRNPKLSDMTLTSISHESSIIDLTTNDNMDGAVAVHIHKEEPIIAAAPSIINEEEEGEADEHELVVEEEKASVGEAVEEEEVEEEVIEEEEVEEEIVEEEEEEDELEEVEYKGKTYYKDADNNVYRLNKDGEIEDTPIGRWIEKTRIVRFTVA